MSALRWWAAVAAGGLMLSFAASASALTCGVTSQGVAFGSYDTLNAAHSDGTGNISVTCDASTSFTVSLSTGGGTYAQRSMSSGANQLGYNLYTDASRTTVWGDGLGGTSNVSATGSNVDLPVYGRIPARQNVPASAYADAITVTVAY